MNHSKNRGQLFSSDFLLALFIFLSALILGLSFFNRFEAEPVNKLENFLTERYNQNQMESLSWSKGFPQDWSSTNPPTVIGLASSPFILDEEKLTELSAWWQLDQNQARSVLGWTKPTRIIIHSLDDETLFAIGDSFSINSSTLSRYSTMAVLNHEVVFFTIEVSS